MRKKRNTGNSRKAHEIKRFLASLQKYVDVCNPDMFGPDSADSEEADDLEKYFVEFPRYRNIYSRSTKFLVARAKKGIGKSALLTHLSVTKKKGKNSIVVFTTGAHLYEFGNPTAATENEATNKWYNIIAQAVCGKLCDYIETPKTKSEFAIVRRCGSFGGKSSIISNLISGLKLKMPFVGFNDFSNITFYRILSEYLNENPTQQVWFIVDDIDSTFKNDEHNVSTVSSFFNAVRTISNDFKNLHIRACVRKDVWTSIRRERESLDKCEDHMLDMEWSASGIRSIIANRIRSFIKLQALNELDHLDHKFLDDIDDSKIISLIFPGTFKWTNSDKFPVYRYIHVLSGGRPRWALQLCKMASAEAGKSQKVVNKLNQKHFGAVFAKYSKYRMRDLYIEHKHQCDNLEHLVTAFDNKKFAYTTAEMIAFIKENITKNICVEIDGNVNCNEQQIAAFLFRTGFLEAVDQRKNVSSENKTLRYDDMPHFFEALPADHSYICWEINPAFRGGLSVNVG